MLQLHASPLARPANSPWIGESEEDSQDWVLWLRYQDFGGCLPLFT